MAGNNEFDILKERIDHLKEIVSESLKSVDQKHDRWQKTQDDDIKDQGDMIRKHKDQIDGALENLNDYVSTQFKDVFESISNLEKAIHIGDQRVVAELEKSKSEKNKYMISTALAVIGLIASIVFGILQF